MSSMRTPGRPCRACPWVEGRAAADIAHFDPERAECLSATSPDAEGTGPEIGAPMFACHESREGEEFACAGWLATQGSAHPGVRLAVMSQRLDPASLAPKPDWPALHPTFAAMITNLRNTWV